MHALAVLALAAGGALAQDAGDRGARDLARSEGALGNDAYLATHVAAAEELARGDAAYAALRARAAARADAREWVDVFEAWRAALAASASGDAVPPRAADASGALWPDPDGTASAAADRRRDGVEAAVHLRLASLAGDELAAWRGRFERLAENELAAARGDARAIELAARGFPATAAGVHAHILRAEVEFEAGHAELAAGWLARATRALALLAGAEPRLATAIADRERLFADLAPAPHASAAEAWERARVLAPAGELVVDESQARAPASALAPGAGLRPGMAFVDEARALVHAPGAGSGGRLVLVDLAHARRAATFDLEALLLERGIEVGPLYRPIDPPGWPLLPAVARGRVVTVVGRRAQGAGNALACFELAPPASLGAPSALRLAWAVLSDSPADGAAAPELAASEFQPGPCIVDGLVVAAVRDYAVSGEEIDAAGVPSGADEIRTALAAFDLETGALRWRTSISKGVEVRRDRLRFTGPSAGASSAQPLAALGTRVFLGTSTGVGALVDALDGRVDWLFAPRRRAGGDRTWSGARPPVDPASAAILWAPPDSDFLYWLRGEPDLDARGLFLHPPWSAGDAEAAAGGDPTSAVVLARFGARRAACALDPASGARAIAPFLGPDEVFAGDGLASGERVYFASTRGLYLLDRTQGLYALDYAPLKALGRPGGSVFARGERVCVLGLTTLWIFQVRR